MISTVKKITVFVYDSFVKYTLRKKARKIISTLKKEGTAKNPPERTLQAYREFWKPVLRGIDVKWLKIYGSVSGLWDRRYVSERIYYSIIEPCLNNKAFAKAYNDKNFYWKTIDSALLPETFVKNINGVFYNSKNAAIDLNEACRTVEQAESFIIKPSVDSGGGKAVRLYRRVGDVFSDKEGCAVKTEELFRNYRKNFTVQKVIKQHEFYACFNATSLNTVRIFTYRSVADEQVHVLHSVLRAGRAGSVTDNQASGGFACGVTDDGCLTGKAVNKAGSSFREVNGVKLEEDLRLPGFESMKKTAKRIAKEFAYSRLLGFDMCVDAEGEVKLIEVNNVNNEINFYQMLNGPLFGEFTKEVLEWVSMKDKSFMIDFDI
ncbi:MAG: hypothetical protein LBV26_05815 [Bacteroidales bacterium]|jgi:hypothetical protein|nr:hypothetical protein [Bacteroidales bacterium]